MLRLKFLSVVLVLLLVTSTTLPAWAAQGANDGKNTVIYNGSVYTKTSSTPTPAPVYTGTNQATSIAGQQESIFSNPWFWVITAAVIVSINNSSGNKPPQTVVATPAPGPNAPAFQNGLNLPGQGILPELPGGGNVNLVYGDGVSATVTWSF